MLIPIVSDTNLPEALRLVGKGPHDVFLIIEFKDGLGRTVSTYKVRVGEEWRNLKIPLRESDIENPVIAAAFTMRVRGSFRDGNHGTLIGSGFDTGEPWGAEILVRCEPAEPDKIWRLHS